MTYIMLAIWLFFIFVLGRGLYRMWTRCLGGAVVDWIMLPATLISELFYSAGRLITGRPVYAGLIAPQKIETDPCRAAISGKNGFAVELLSVALSITATTLCFLLICKFLSGDTIALLNFWELFGTYSTLPKNLPTSWDDFWSMMIYQVKVLDRYGEVLSWKDYHDWKSVAFVYGSAVFAVRFGPVRHDLRATLITGGVIVLLLSLLGWMSKGVDDFVAGPLWCMLTYLWATLLMLLFITLVVLGIAELVVIFLNKGQGKSRGSSASEE